MNTEKNGLVSRRQFLKSTALAGTALAAGLSTARAAGAVNIRYFWRAAWPSSDVYANWLIDEWNKQNGDRIRVNGASVDGET
jgi:raffinose/stachyose/melibiose transport system substrate-binding protein